MRTKPAVIVSAVMSLPSTCLADAVMYAVPAPPPATEPHLWSLSSDGTAACGNVTRDGYLRPMRWTLAGGAEAMLGDSSGIGEAPSCSGGGEVVTFFGGLYAGLTGYIWSDASGWNVLPMPPETWYVVPWAVSENGLAVAGYMTSTGGFARPFRWTESLGYEYLHNVPADNACAFAISADGTTVAGAIAYRPYVWHHTSGLTPIPADPSIELRYAVSYDGRYIVGSDNASGWRFDRLDQSMQRLLWNDGTPFTAFPRSVCADGSIVVGGRYDRAFIWDSKHGARYLDQVLTTEQNLDLTGWTLTDAIGISADGNVIAGNGRLNGRPTSWIVALETPVPFTGRPPCQGDVDEDLQVGLIDLGLVLSEFRLPGSSATYDCTGDGVVDALDVDVVMHDLGDRCGRVPRPGTPN
jgi:hypothetical protein